MRVHISSFLVGAFLFAPLVAQEELDPVAAIQRLELISLGTYQLAKQNAPPTGPSDVELCIRALRFRGLQDQGLGLRVAACRAATAMVRHKFFPGVPVTTRAELTRLVIEALGGEHGKLAESASGTLRELARRDGLLARRDLHSAIAQALGLVLRDDVESRRRAGLLLGVIVAHGNENTRQQVARTVLTALERYPPTPDDGDREAVARSVLRAVLVRVETKDRPLADELAGKFLSDLQSGAAWGFRYARGDALRGLGRVFAVLPAGRRQAAFEVLLAAVGDRHLQFITTSGVRSPQRHHGHEAIALAAPSFSAAEVEAAAKAIRIVRKRDVTAGVEAQDLQGIYQRVEESLSQRRASLKGSKVEASDR